VLLAFARRRLFAVLVLTIRDELITGSGPLAWLGSLIARSRTRE
jgi:hypothetical protein